MVKFIIKKILSFAKEWMMGTFSDSNNSLSSGRQFVFLFVLACIAGMFMQRVPIEKLYFGGVMILLLLGKITAENIVSLINSRKP